jgi:uncharacterized protein
VRVVIAGGSGYIGGHLAESLIADGHEVIVLTRSPAPAVQPGIHALRWDAQTAAGAWVSELSSTAAIINLAGTSIGGGRWTRRRMSAILASRLAATSAIVDAIRQTPAVQRPRVLVSASGIDYYGDRGEEAVTEESAPGDSFLARVSQQWEATAQTAEALGIRVVRIRTALVFGRGALAFRLLTLPYRLFVGGRLGTGRQWFTWIHIADLVGLYRLTLEQGALSGPVNAVAPDLLRQRDVAREIGRVLHRPSVVPAPALLLRLALGRQAELLLDGRRATPEKAQRNGYRFRFGDLRAALDDTLR